MMLLKNMNQRLIKVAFRRRPEGYYEKVVNEDTEVYTMSAFRRSVCKWTGGRKDGHVLENLKINFL